MNDSTTSLEDLINQKNKIESQIKSRLLIEKKTAIARIILDMKKFDIGLQEIEKEMSKKSSNAKYMNPKTGQTWTGKGKRPKWISDEMENGGDIEKFSIK